ncbi:MAG: Two-component sensor kinase [Microgenomates group bacterium GW2011_GWC1_39_7b]|uniref:histidine kinase n=2 Tax=Candidatus Woeseibacteriota TaxID=1752722 RepID=A0A0G0P0K4_9BACT|nr:MAG: Multi-sensor signal transduction histidine kinase [Candidatus Woesebacteria bacterium GW2011_GWB1_39_10]KKR26222.1 MAG: Two-component sensor kinase [Microgenomates group bacterium GW2011_GWC1_39_7b]KKR71825.1 MAG: Multi-sensor signal transduction histidine kinase [Candidatus Woesebacteria bacterium GW2011_GWA2_40_7]
MAYDQNRAKTFSANNEKITSKVKDEGIGIPNDEKSHIFTRFYRASNAKTAHPDGSGLGLYIVKSIVESSGGKIWFESEVDKGTTFFFSLPLSGMKAKEGEAELT